ncbi:two-component system, NtrC family, sensor kinase [Thermotomaculum hydrothermale]|uniref:histidine kinase n=1 Tax=Thermotomaculum hydrothermale TaxID=981385 RepID=A0A7R6PFA2_9BACT|nr:ATP-binding protein [Thermotomaculum hydrothermale]BBB32659.1 two-component system, NtrC family, sensor kinase [Thermotomaculum hydrothermale]
MRSNILSSIKTKLFVFLGFTLTFFLFLIFIYFGFIWKKLIVRNYVNAIKSTARAFAVDVKNKLILKQNKLEKSEDILAGEILAFLKDEKDALFIAVYSPSGKVLISSEKIPKIKLNEAKELSKNIKDISVRIYKNHSYGWIGECYYPIKSGEKELGILHIGMNASYLANEVKFVSKMFYISTLFILLFVILIIYIVTEKFTRSIITLSNLLEDIDVEKDRFVKFPEFKDETGLISRKLNELQNKIGKAKENVKIAERKILQAEKLASIGRLASGVAHEINNPLNGIKHCITLIKENPEDRETNKEYIDLINEGVDYISEIVKKLLEFARSSQKDTTKVLLKECLDSVLSLIDYHLNKESIEINKKIDEKEYIVSGNKVLIQEVIMNVLQNSIDALKTRENKKITLLTKEENEKIILEIKDNGRGIEKEYLTQIFDPFFTTKPVGEGTGLGLYVALGIMKTLKGDIKIESEKDKYTKVTLIFKKGDKN